MKYCPNLSCPHRRRVLSPAEFYDHITKCSDCSAPLVDSEEKAIAGLGLDATSAAPYRKRGSISDPPPAAPTPQKPSNDIAVGLAFLGGGVLLTALTYASASADGGRYIVAWGPMAYGLYRILRRSR